jgi:predicted transcriptional regulator
MGIPLTIDLDEGSARVLDEIAATRDTSRESLVQDAVAAYLTFEARQREKIRDGLAAAERGDFASDEDVARVFSAYRRA